METREREGGIDGEYYAVNKYTYAQRGPRSENQREIINQSNVNRVAIHLGWRGLGESKMKLHIAEHTQGYQSFNKLEEES